jgi:light-regulated signal transduction histidine kinase (bacteriophytochrome)
MRTGGSKITIQPGLTVTGDSRLLRVALTDLLSNAAKFTGKQTMPRIEFGRTEDDGQPAFYVRDNGAGFDMAHAGLLFEPFQRLHKQSEFAGSGIGLATAYRIVHRHGGRIWAEAQVNTGCDLLLHLDVTIDTAGQKKRAKTRRGSPCHWSD